ncbi:MAG: DNA-deoxyinosine glycosylase [Coriobacteriales bacterium]
MPADADDGYVHLEHTIDPVFDERCTLLVLGSFPSAQSREARFFYGNPRNRFWRVLATLFGQPVPPDEPVCVSTDAKRRLLHDCHVALWDVVASCDIRGSSDASIRDVVPTDLSRILGSCPIEAVFGNGGTATRLYRRYQEQVTGRPITGLPSTSPANASYSLERLVQVWGDALRRWLPGG